MRRRYRRNHVRVDIDPGDARCGSECVGDAGELVGVIESVGVRRKAVGDDRDRVDRVAGGGGAAT